MKRAAFLLVLLPLIYSSCSEDDGPNGTLVVDGKRFPLDRLYSQAIVAPDHSHFLLVVCNKNGTLANYNILGTNVHYIRLTFYRDQSTNKLIPGTFAQDQVQMHAGINYDSENAGDSGTRFNSFSPGTLKIVKKGSQYKLTFSGECNDSKITAVYEGPLTSLPDDIEL